MECYDYAKNNVDSYGTIMPSSESMTHGAIYDLSPEIRWVFHGHCKTIWEKSGALHLPTTSPSIPYGTPEMALEVGRLWAQTPLSETRVFSMGGHEDGIVSFGTTAEEAGKAFIAVLAQAYELQCSPVRGLC